LGGINMYEVWIENKLCGHADKIKNIPLVLEKTTAYRINKGKTKIPFSQFVRKGWKNKLIRAVENHEKFIKSKYGSGLNEFPCEIEYKDRMGYSVIVRVEGDLKNDKTRTTEM
jgi:hypothetical protein